MKPFSLILTAFAFMVSSAAAAELFVIAHPSLNISVDAIRDVFVGEKQFQAGIKLAAVDNLSCQKDFLEKVMKLDGASYGKIWTKKSFRDGLNAPPTRSGDAEVLAYVRANAGAIGYVTSLPNGVKTVAKF
jgi:ABC-type phosphate transport system substrate-binding protein